MKSIYDYKPVHKRPVRHLQLTEDAVRFDQRLRWLMDWYGIGSPDVADAVYVCRNTIDKYAMGLRRPSLEIAVLLADFFDVSLDWLAGRTSEMRPWARKEDMD